MLATATLLLAGCGRDHDRIRAYRIPKEQAPEIAAAAMTNVPPPVAMEMRWDLPDGWVEVQNTVAMRFATLIAGEGEQQLEVAITQLGGVAGGIAANINRWRGQIGLAPASEDELAREAERIDAVGGPGVMVDLIGPALEGSAEPPLRMFAAIFPTQTHTWFIKATAEEPIIAQHRDGFLALCRSVRFEEPEGAQASAPPPGAAGGDAATGPGGGDATPVFGALPDGWSADATPKPMSIASFTIAEDAGTASLTITPLGGAQDTLANINRWRRQVGLPPVTALEEQGVAPIEVADRPGVLVDIGGAEQRTLGVIVVQEQTTWFYKLTGPEALVADRKPEFESFIREIRFEGGSDE